MRNEPRYEDKLKDDPMAAKTVKEYIAYRDCHNKCGVEPEEHPHMIHRPEVVRDPLYKPAVDQRFVKNVNNV